MNKFDAAKVLNLSGKIDPTATTKAYKRAAMKYHPDRNPAGLEMMKAVNQAYAVLKDFEGDLETEAQASDYGDELNAAINAAMAIVEASAGAVVVELMGAWLWVTGETKPYSAQLNRKTGAGFFWASKKKAWYFKPEGERSRSRGTQSLDDIRGAYGSVTPKRSFNRALRAS